MIHFIKGNQIELLRNGTDYFPALVKAINDAKHFVYIQTYIFAHDETGKLIANALMQAAQRGVKTHLLIDGFGGKDFPKQFLKELKQGGVGVRFYRPQVSPWTFKKSRLRRLHRKVTVVDGEIGFVGGINIINDSEVPDKTPPRLDYALRIKGNLLPQITASVQKMWQRTYWASHRFWRLNLKKPHVPAAKSKNGIEAAFVIRDNIFHKRDIETAYLNAINHAKSEIILANAYFLPGRKFRHALTNAAQRGVTVKLLLQGRKEFFLMFATHAFYNVLLKHGIEIYEYRQGFMHSKVAVIDSYWATVGSSNIDPFSLLLAQEANVIIQDSDFAEELRKDLLSCVTDCAHRVNPSRWMSGHKFKRICSWIAYGLVKLFLGLIGRPNNH